LSLNTVMRTPSSTAPMRKVKLCTAAALGTSRNVWKYVKSPASRQRRGLHSVDGSLNEMLGAAWARQPASAAGGMVA
jgi:hypothetical protein